MNFLLIISLVLFCFSPLCADSVVMPSQDYDLSGIPPSATQLLRQERQTHESETIASFQKIVQKAVEQQTKKKAKRANKLAHKSPQRQMLSSAIASLVMQQSSISQEILNILEKQLDDPELQEKRVSLTLKKMPIKDALALLSKCTGVQLVIDGDVTGSVQDLKLDDIPLAAALHSILGSNDPRLTLIKEFGVWRVMKLQTAREMFAGMAAREREKDFEAAVFQICHAQWNDALKSRIEKLWQGITQNNIDKQNIYLVFDDDNRKVFFKGRKSQADEFDRYLKEIDIKIPQVRIDARVVIASKNFEEALGFKWSGVYNRRASVNHVDFIGLGPVNASNGNGSTANTPFNDIIGWSLNFVPTTLAKIPFQIPFVFGNNDMNTKRLNLELNAAENRNELKTILKPSLLVFNQEAAEILVGQEVPHSVRLDETIESRLTNITTVNYKDVGMKIKVKPTVSPDHNAVFLDVFVENSFITRPDITLQQGVDTSTNVGSTASNFNYTIKTSRSRNRVLLRSGQTTLIGGLITNSLTKEQTGIPMLQDIPVLGWLFKGTRRQKTDEQLLIFITPTLVDA